MTSSLNAGSTREIHIFILVSSWHCSHAVENKITEKKNYFIIMDEVDGSRYSNTSFENINIPVSTFHKLNTYITIKERKEYTHHYNIILKYFENEMKSVDPLFDKMFKGHELGGSYADQLKVSKPNEFDTVLKLKMMVDYKKIKVI